MHEAAAVNSTTSLLSLSIIIELIGIIFGIFAVFTIIRALSKVGGQVGAAFTLTLFGVIFQMSALTYNIITPLDTLASHNIHETLMIVGIIFFVLAARQFAKVSQ